MKGILNNLSLFGLIASVALSVGLLLHIQTLNREVGKLETQVISITSELEQRDELDALKASLDFSLNNLKQELYKITNETITRIDEVRNEYSDEELACDVLPSPLNSLLNDTEQSVSEAKP